MSSSVDALSLDIDIEGETMKLALTHRSYAFESAKPDDHNERLEFLGDAILEAVVTELIYNSYPELAEGEMARLRASVVNTHALADLARDHDLGKHLKLGRGEEASGGRDKDSILADAFEAVVGAVFIDEGFDKARVLLGALFAERLQRSLETGRRYDVKTALQEVVVRKVGGSPEYRITSSGPDHDKRFVAEVFVAGASMGVGEGRSKKEAEYKAAQQALESLESEGSHARAG